MTWRLLVAWIALLGAVSAAESSRPRLAVLTDIGGDPDDRQSMVRLMAYANEFQTAPVTREVPADRPWIIEGRKAYADHVALQSSGAAR